MIAGVYFAGAPFAGVLRAAGAAAAALAGSASLTFSTAGALDNPPQYLAASAAIVWTADGALDSPPAYLAADATIVFTVSGNVVVPIETTTGITIDGINVTGRVRIAGVTIHDVLNDAPNTLSFTLEGEAPAVGQRVRFMMGPRLMFAGSIQTVDQAFELQPKYLAWDVTVIDDTAEANARRPFGTFFDTSATTIAQTITTQFAPTFSTAGIEAGLPPVTIVFDGADPLIACLSRLATAVGGYCKINDQTVYLFTEDVSEPPNPISEAFPFLHDPPISITTDASQLRTRVYGKGYGEHVPADINAGETLIPIQDGVLFPAAGGTAIAGLTADGAQSERLAFTSVVLGGPGSLVGTGAGPSTAPGVTLLGGTGIESGVHDYAFLFQTAAGTSAPSPLARVTLGPVAPPATALSAGAATGGGGLNPGTHRYYAVFRTAAGATTAGPVSNAITAGAGIAPPSPGPTAYPGGTTRPTSALDDGAWYSWGYTFWDGGARETTLSAAATTHIMNGDASNHSAGAIDISPTVSQPPTPPAGFQLCWYRTDGGVSAPGPTFKRLPFGQAQGQFSERVTGSFEGNPQIYLIDIVGDAALGPAAPTVDRSGLGTSSLTGIPVSANTLVTTVDLYREFNNAGASTARLALSVANGTTTASDTVANASLGATVPATNTAIGNRVQVSWPAAASSSVTNIHVYRTAANSAQLRLLSTVGSNTAGSLTDSTADAALGANAPTGDTSGLQQPQGQVNPGSPTLPVASSAPFRAAGGWVTLGGGQVVRHTGISGNTLTGIPATGSGAIATAVIYGSQALPTPMLVGVTGLTRPMLDGSAVHVWIERNDVAAQAEHAARTGGDGIVEYLIVDARRGVPSLTARCDAELALFSRPIVTVAYATRDLKTISGKSIVIDLPSQGIVTILTIQDVTITEIDIVPGIAPRFSVKASSVRFSLEDTLRRLIAGGLTKANT